jgi:hypothetical protein
MSHIAFTTSATHAAVAFHRTLFFSSHQIKLSLFYCQLSLFTISILLLSIPNQAERNNGVRYFRLLGEPAEPILPYLHTLTENGYSRGSMFRRKMAAMELLWMIYPKL